MFPWKCLPFLFIWNAYCLFFLPHTLAQNPPLLASELICGRDQLQVGLRWADMVSSGLNAFSGHLVTRNCTYVRVRDDIVWFEVERRAGSCGNTLTVKISPLIPSGCYLIIWMVMKSNPPLSSDRPHCLSLLLCIFIMPAMTCQLIRGQGQLHSNLRLGQSFS